LDGCLGGVGILVAAALVWLSYGKNNCECFVGRTPEAISGIAKVRAAADQVLQTLDLILRMMKDIHLDKKHVGCATI